MSQLSIPYHAAPSGKTHGTLKLIRDTWHIQADPHVMIKLKQLFNRVSKSQFGTVTLHNSPEVCRDLEWFLLRYPMEVENFHALTNGSLTHQAMQRDMELITRPGYTPRNISLADGATLREYQSVAVEMLLRRGSLLCADELGLGKSLVAIGACTDGQSLPALIVCQAHLPTQWKERYLDRFLPGAKAHVIKSTKVYELPSADAYIISYHKLAKWAEVLSGFIRQVHFDEVQELRNRVSNDGITQKYAAAEHIAHGAKVRAGYSGTPIFGYGGEIWNIMNILAPNSLGTWEEFTREWCVWLGGNKWKLTDPAALGTHLRDLSLMIRRTRAEVGRELPQVETIVQEVPYSEDVMKSLDSTATELAHRILKGGFHESGEAAREFDMKLRQTTGVAKAPAVADFVRMLVESGEKVLLGAWHRSVYDIYEEKLRDLGIMFYTGEESAKQKERAVQAILKGEINVLAMSLRSGAGIDGLQQAVSVAVIGELDWASGVHKQFIGRIDRDGQTKPVQAYYLISDAGSDPTVAGVLGLKSAQLAGILDPGSSGIQEMKQEDAARVKRLAEDYLRRK